ncbi:MAG: family 78 glycoside hydrolase catalytic domain [Clostridia bacterium]|nr:family 78 glycoside hydrolase catalytic domain [Clostridia bacterium]
MQLAKWIWDSGEAYPDSYSRFFKTFESHGGDISIELSCDSNYEMYVNGQLAGFGQYADYPYHKVYDTIDLTPFCHKGSNRISILVWYFGVSTLFGYSKATAGLIYEIKENGKTIAYSDTDTLCKKAEDYCAGRQKLITRQLGFSYTYNCALYDGCNASHFEAKIENGWHNAVRVVDLPEELYPRPNKKLVFEAPVAAKCMDQKRRIYDLGEETVGYWFMRFRAPKGSLVRILYGEHLVQDENGESAVQRIIKNRDFSLELYGSGEWFDFSNFMRRLGCRYLQVECEDNVDVESIGMHPVVYPLTVLPYQADTPLHQRIYDVSVKTLRCCMFEHYEDCPWREQALYTMDSRNQMLCGYYAFGEYAFARASLELMCLDRREDGQLHITFPTDQDFVIPSFTLYWLLQMREYAEYSKDLSLIQIYSDKMDAVLDRFLQQKENGLIVNFHSDVRYWNFYEWQPTLQGLKEVGRVKSVDLVLNALLSFSLRQRAVMLRWLGRVEEACKREEQSCALNEEINRAFWSQEKQLYTDKPGVMQFSALGNSFAILCGAADLERSAVICDNLLSNEDVVPTTLSMKTFHYDAMLATDEKKYASVILRDIDSAYSYMLDQGATTFWETLKGAEDFGNAGSLCHGWSAIPIFYYQRLLK